MSIVRVPGDIVITARRKRTIFWAVCIAVLALGLIVAWGNQPTTSGKAQAAVFFGLFIALCAFLWWYQNRLRSRIQVPPSSRSSKAAISPRADQVTAWTSATSRGPP
jgi:hypothetical protein